MTRYLALLTVLALTAACGSSTSGPALTGTLNVFAASSLTDSFKALGASFDDRHPGATVRFNFAGSPTLVSQLESGALADVFASADTTNMEKLQTDGLLAHDPGVFARNELEIVVAPGNPKRIHVLADLAKPGVIYIAAGPTVPAGKYAAQILKQAGVTVTAKSLETDVKSVVGKIELGEADAGIVYVTDVKAAGAKVSGVGIPAADNVIATYPIAPLKTSSNLSLTDVFVAYVISPEGQAKLKEYGFLVA